MRPHGAILRDAVRCFSDKFKLIQLLFVST